MADAHPLEEGPQIDAQILALTNPARNPDQARIVDEFGLRTDDRDLGVGVLAPDRSDCGQGGEPGPDDGDSMHG
jgi:hypothetical protein